MSSCILFGGSGFIGTHLARRFLESGRFSHIHIADTRPTSLAGTPGVTYSDTDVRRPVPVGLISETPEWIFNLAAVHREPGHQPFEYYDTNIPGARNVCDYAETIGCDNMYFTSSISVYGPTDGPTDERSSIRPITPYGGSKYPAEIIHEAWMRGSRDRRMLISRPGFIYGPDDPGNIMRMINAVRKGYFAFPGSPDIYKSYGYVHGFCDSVDFLMERDDQFVVYNYVETPTQPLRELVDTIKDFLDCGAMILPIPLWALLPAARIAQALLGTKCPIHPVRVRKAATPTHIIPRLLREHGFQFRYRFLDSLEHWQAVAPEDFGLKKPAVSPARKLKLVKKDSQPKAPDRTEIRDVDILKLTGKD